LINDGEIKDGKRPYRFFRFSFLQQVHTVSYWEVNVFGKLEGSDIIDFGLEKSRDLIKNKKNLKQLVFVCYPKISLF